MAETWSQWLFLFPDKKNKLKTKLFTVRTSAMKVINTLAATASYLYFTWAGLVAVECTRMHYI